MLPLKHLFLYTKNVYTGTFVISLSHMIHEALRNNKQERAKELKKKKAEIRNKRN